MVKIPSDTFANSSIQRYNDMVKRQQKMMDRINGSELKRTALRADMVAAKMIDRLEYPNALKTYSQGLQTSLDRVNSLQTQIGSLQRLTKRMNDPLSLAASIQDSYKLGASSEIKGLATTLRSNVNLSTKFADDLNKSLRPALGAANRLKSLDLTGADRVLKGYSSAFERLGGSAGMVGAEFAVSTAKKQLKFSKREAELLDSILESAKAFEEEIGSAEMEEAAEEVLDQDTELSSRVNSAPVLRHYSLSERRIVSFYIALVVYLLMASLVLYGKVEQPALLEILEIFGVIPSPDAAGLTTYALSMKISKRYAEEESEEN